MKAIEKIGVAVENAEVVGCVVVSSEIMEDLKEELPRAEGVSLESIGVPIYVSDIMENEVEVLPIDPPETVRLYRD